MKSTLIEYFSFRGFLDDYFDRQTYKNITVQKDAMETIVPPVFGNDMTFCEVITPEKLHLNFSSQHEIKPDKLSTDGGRITLSKSKGHECNVNLSKAAIKDEGQWYFHIIHGSRLNIQWYFHKVYVVVKTRRVVSVDERGAKDQIPNQHEPEVAKQNASSALVVIGVVCALALIVAVVVIVKRKSKNNIEDNEVPANVGRSVKSMDSFDFDPEIKDKTDIKMIENDNGASIQDSKASETGVHSLDAFHEYQL